MEFVSEQLSDTKQNWRGKDSRYHETLVSSSVLHFLFMLSILMCLKNIDGLNLPYSVIVLCLEEPCE